MDTQKKKPWYKSKTIWGSIVAFGATVAGVFGLEIGADEQKQIVEALAALGGVAGLVLTIVGRVKAKGAVTATSASADATK